MERSSTLLLAACLLFTTAQAQTSDIVVFSEMGEKFTLVVDGDVKNETPASRVVALGIKNPTPLLVVRFADATIPPLKQNAWMEPGQEYTLRITTNRKGEHVLRMQGMVAHGTSAKTDADKPAPTNFVDDPVTSPDPAQNTPVTEAVDGGTTHTTTTTTQTTGDNDQVDFHFGVSGNNVDMHVNDGTGNGQVTSKTTTTTTVTRSSNGNTQTGNFMPPAEKPRNTSVRKPTYSMPGYTGPVGCGSAPMSDEEFAEVKKNIGSKGFEETKLTVAKQIGRDHCFTTAQVRGIMQLFGFEDSKLDFAKFAYDHTYDIGNYYKVNDVFGFESSVNELDQYIRSR